MVRGRNLVCRVMLFVLPVSLAAQDSGRALLRSQGGTWLNGSVAPESSAIFPDDLIQTEAGHIAKIDADGSSVTIQAETVVQFRGDELLLDHGSVQVNTARRLKVRVNCLTVIPVSDEWTQYDVTDTNGKVTVVALKNDDNLHTQGAITQRSRKTGTSDDATVREGETVTRDEHCPATARLPGSIDATGAWLNTWPAKAAGIAAVTGLMCWVFCTGGDGPVSPKDP